MKKIFFAPMIAVILGLTAMAQDIRATATVPSLCKPCVFYAGDYNTDDPNAQGFNNGDTLLTGQENAIYAAVDVPKNENGAITGILFMNIATQNTFDPPTATYDIRTGVSNGEAGTSVANGSGPISYALWGQAFGYSLYQTAVNLTKPFTVTPGTRYWSNMSPQCTNPGDSACSLEQFFEVNTTQRTNGLHAGAQPPYQIFGGTPGGPLSNVCNGNDTPMCEWASFGLMGHGK